MNDSKVRTYFLVRFLTFLILVMGIAPLQSSAQSLTELRYEIGTLNVTELYVDPATGSDSRAGTSQSAAFKTLTAAWNVIPQNQTLTTGYRINILSGTIPESGIPNYLEARHGTYAAPIIIRALNGRGTVTLAGDLNMYDVRYFYLQDIIISPSPAGDAFHCEQCGHILIRNCELSGGNRSAHETVKVNQSQYVYIEDSNIHGADDNAIDFVAVQYGHIARSRIHDAQDWCAYAKGGSAYLRIEGNEIYDCGTGGFTAGQGTGFEFMVSPWIHYEAYDLKIINNIIHDTEGAGLGVNGGYNILLAHNTLYRVGSRSHTVELVFGARSCDGSSASCQANLDLGGWGTASVGGDVSAPIGNRNVYIYNNLIYNPSGFTSGQHFAIYGPQNALSGSNVPGPVQSDVNLQIKGNVIYNGVGASSLGVGEDSGCQSSNTTCNEEQLVAQNTINGAEPQLINPASDDFRPTEGSNLFGVTTYEIPDFVGGDRQATPLADAGNLDNTFLRDRSEAIRIEPSTVGAYASASSSLLPPGGDSDTNTDEPPTISRAKCSPKKAKVKATITCEVTARDDASISRVSILTNGSTKARLKRSGGKYKGSFSFKKKGSYALSSVVTDSGRQTATKAIGTCKIAK